MRIAVIGANGRLGTALVEAFTTHEVIAWTRRDFDITDHEGASRAILDRHPHVVINTAAYHNTEECEQHPHRAFEINAVAVGYLTSACDRAGAVLVHISTDYVFGGQQEAPYSEEDTPSPINVYGISKLAGEHLVARAGGRHCIVRVAGLFGGPGSGAKGGSFVERILGKAERGEEIRVVDDVRMSPTYAIDAASRIREIVESGAGAGVFHITNAGSCTWYEFARTILTIAGVPATVQPWTLPESGSPVPRPKNSVLVTGRLDRGLRPLRTWQDALVHYLEARDAQRTQMVTVRD